MPFGRLLLIGMFLCAAAAFTQDHPLSPGKAGGNLQPTADLRSPSVATPSEPWRIIPKSENSKDLIVMAPELGSKGVVVSPDGPLAAETTCYAIRSYVVARDSKDSDSVHPVRYSTCIPASRYRLKTADGHASLER